MNSQMNISTCDNTNCNGGRAFQIRECMFCSPRCGNIHFNLSRGDEEYWSNEEQDEEDEEENTCTDISVETIHQHIEYDIDGYEDCDEGVLGLSIMWDYENEEIDDLMGNEHRPKIGQNLNLMWIEKIKEMIDWKLGEKLYIETEIDKTNGSFNCLFSKHKFCVGDDFIVEKNGYVSVRVLNRYTMDEDDEDGIKWSFMVRAESVYNDINYNLRKKCPYFRHFKENR